jgi:spermidine synthase
MSPGKSRLGQLMLVFTLSGLSGLIYQSIWSHYLGLTLGHAAYAQTLVLAIFMGGLALGSWLASHWVRRLDNAVRVYARVELVIGVFALGFHPLCQAYTTNSQDVVLPSLSPSLVHAYQWGSSALLILPQCVLLGTTFPLIASACIRVERGEGRSLGGLYFSNSLGAAIGALVATFVLLPWIGMPGAMAFAGVVNLLVATRAWSLSRAEPGDDAGSAPARQENAHAPVGWLRRGVLLAAAITGATSFVYEVVWVRMLNMALGTTLHSFELMLAAFILGLAAGGYWIHRRGDSSPNTLWLAGVSQVLMGLCALASALAFAHSFAFVGWLVGVLPRTDAGYGWFNLGSASVALLVMFPTAFFAGSTLPLFTMSLLRRGQGERAVGWVYASNTLGAIVGVFAVVHLLIPILGLRLSLLLAASVDIALGVVLLAWFGEGRAQLDKRLGLAAGLAMLVVALLFGRVDPLAAASGVYRDGKLLDARHDRVRFLADGKTATVAVFESGDGRGITIATNGKPDAGMTRSFRLEPLADEVTMVMLGALPLALHEHPTDVAAIGWGSGLTTHTVLGSPRVKRMETVEIEPAMVHGARSFGERVRRAYEDPRSHIVYEDARTWFSAARRKYDVIISEPSNPWVSGVASLYTEEFYGFTGHHLKPGGLFVQWLQSYEISDELQARMVSALLKRFRYADAYLTNSTDLVLVASDSPLPPVDWKRLSYDDLETELARVGLVNDQALALRRVGGRGVLEAYVRMNGAQVGHSDFYPEVALRAPLARYKGDFALELPSLGQNGMPVLDAVDGRKVPNFDDIVPWDRSSSQVAYQVYSKVVNQAFHDPRAMADLKSGNGRSEAKAIESLLALSRQPVAMESMPRWSANLAQLAQFGPGALAPEDLKSSWIDATWLSPGQGPLVSAVMAAYRAAALRDAAGMRANATQVLADATAPIAPQMREQMLVIALAGAAGQGDRPGMLALQSKYGRAIPASDTYDLVRRFLLAWAQPGS